MSLLSAAAEQVATYEPPKVLDFGSLEEVTAGAATGNFLDRTFEVGTHVDDLTFT
jgi:hypothetical protein